MAVFNGQGARLVDYIFKILKVEDQPDGSAKIEVDCCEETYKKVFEYGFIALMKKGIENEEKDKE